MAYLIVGFMLGLIIPFIARRLGKILPATMGEIILQLIRLPKVPQTHNPLQYRRLKRKWIVLWCYAFGMGCLTAGLFWAAKTYLPNAAHIFAYIFIWTSLCAAETDRRHYLLPDCLTLPLLLVGFLFAVRTNILTPIQSLYGAFFAYLLTTLAVFILNLKKQIIFGAGDTKMAIALGAWLGIQGLNYTIFLSFFLFLMSSLMKQKNTGAYGPALGLAGLITFFIQYLK